MTSAVYDIVFATIKEDYGVEKVTFSHLICEMAKYRSGTVTKAEYGLTAVAFLKNLQDKNALNLDDDTYTMMYQKIIEDM
jgi:hypothetical protein